jgi:hypothetical protein
MLKWTKQSKYHWVDNNNLYSISATKVQGKWVYMLWDFKTKQFLGRFESPRTAREAANDLNGNRRKSN